MNPEKYSVFLTMSDIEFLSLNKINLPENCELKISLTEKEIDEFIQSIEDKMFESGFNDEDFNEANCFGKMCEKMIDKFNHQRSSR